MHIQEKLEWGSLATPAPNKTEPVHNWFYYKEAFSKQLVMKVLDMFGTSEGQLVLDPFCGVGTTMLACKERGMDSVGFDAHPLAVFVSRVKLRDYRRVELLREMNRILESRFVKPRLRIKNRLMKRGFPKQSLEEIVFYRDLIMQARNKDVRDFLLLGLMNVAMRCSWINKDGAVIKIKKKKNIPFPRKVLKNQFKRMLKDLDRIRFQKSRVRVDFGDARRLGLTDNLADFIITSPPYLNKREYESVFSIEQGLFLDMIGFGPYSDYIGSDIKELEKDSAKLLDVLGDETRLPKTAVVYFLDMFQAIEEMYRVCRPRARVAVVVGNGCFPSGVVDSDLILSKIAESVGFRAKRIVVLNKRWWTKKRTKKGGIMRESLLVWEK